MAVTCMSDEPATPQTAINSGGGCRHYVAGFVVGVLVAIGTIIFLGDAEDRAHVGPHDGGFGMFLTFYVFPILAIVLGISGIAIAWIMRKPWMRSHRWILWTLLVVFVAYPLSEIPASLAVLWLRNHSQGDYSAVVDLIYAPAQWPFKTLFGWDNR
jgi:hypothetical protein